MAAVWMLAKPLHLSGVRLASSIRLLATAATAPSAGAISSTRQSLERDGYAIVRKAIDADLVRETQQHIDWLLKKYPDIPPEHYHHIIMRNDPFWVRLVSDPRLVDIACSAVPFLTPGGPVALFSSHYFCKLPGSGMAVKWHQDGSYWPLRPMDVVTLWLAVDRSDAGNGGLRVVPKSHQMDLKDLRPAKATRNVLGSATHDDDEISEAEVVNIELDPGDISIHHPNLIHGSLANTSSRRRCGLTIRYISPKTECTDKDQPVMMMRGDPVLGVNNYRSWPKYRPGYDMPFKGCDQWNSVRRISPLDEAYFARTDYGTMEAEIRVQLNEFIDQLGGR